MNLPDDPFEEGVHCDDACEAMGVGVLGMFAEGVDGVTIVKGEDGSYVLYGWTDEDD